MRILKENQTRQEFHNHHPTQRVYINSLNDFKKHVRSHRERVVKLGNRLAQNFYQHLDLDLVELFLRQHDSAKDLDVAHKVYKSELFELRPPGEILFDFYAKLHLDQNRKIEREKIVKKINRLDSLQAEIFFEKYSQSHSPLSDKIRLELVEIERIADLVDRGLDPVAKEEFAKNMVLASEWVTGEKDRKMARFLELNYEVIVSGSEYKKI